MEELWDHDLFFYGLPSLVLGYFIKVTIFVIDSFLSSPDGSKLIFHVRIIFVRLTEIYKNHDIMTYIPWSTD